MSAKKNLEQRKKTREKPAGGSKQIRKVTIKDARNTWELETLMTDKLMFDLKGFRGYYFVFDGENLECFKREIKRVSDSGKMASFDDRFNLVSDAGERKTLRMKNLKRHLKEFLT